MSARRIDAGPLPTWLAPLTVPASWVYGLGAWAHAALDARGPKVHAGIRTVSVGNVTAGGTGKTPFVRWCAAQLAAAGHRPAIALRGYRAHDGASDEADEYRDLLPGVPLAVGGDRAAAIAAMRAMHPEVDCVVLDDGFQHRRLARDLDIVLVDATRPGLGGRLLPAGWLRERASVLRRADQVVVTRAHAADEPALAALIEAMHGRPAVAWTRYDWTGLRVACDGALRDESVGWLRGRSVVAAAAIGNPSAFLAQCEASGARIQATELRPDHAAYDRAAVGRIAALAQAAADPVVVLTGKDWVKVRAHAADHPGIHWVVPVVGLRFLSGEQPLLAALRGGG
jgi:tetraacyldisaccharide 4'-kinase